MAGMGRPGTTVQFCNPKQRALPTVVLQLGMVPLGGDQSMRMVLLWDGEADNLNKVSWTALSCMNLTRKW